MLWCNDIVKFIIDKALELGVQTYFYIGDKETYSFFSSYANKEFIDWLNNQLAGTVNTEYFYDIGHHWALYTLKDQSFFY